MSHRRHITEDRAALGRPAMRGGIGGHRLVRLLTFCSFAAVWLVAAASGQPPRDTAEPILYRRIYVPAENTDAWPLAGERYLPISQRELEELISTAGAAAGGGLPAVRIERAEYSARLAAAELLEGRATLHIASEADGPRLVDLSRANFSITDATWTDDGQQEPQRAQLGLRYRSKGEAPRLGAVVPGSGTLELSWQTHLAGNASATPYFDLRFPFALSTRLLLDLPVDRRPTVEGGILQPPSDVSAGGDQVAGVEIAAFRRWPVTVAAEHLVSLRVPSESPAADSANAGGGRSIRHRLVYRVHEQGVDLTARLTLNGLEADGRMSLSVDPRLAIVAAEVDGQAVAWQIQTDPAAVRPRAVIPLPTAEADSSNVSATRTVTVRAWGSWPAGEMWSLPLIHGDESGWAGGILEVAIPDDLVLEELTPLEGTVIDVGRIEDAEEGVGDVSGGLRYLIAQHTPTSDVQLQLARRPAEPSAEVGTTLLVGDPEIEGVAVVRYATLRGSLHQLEAELRPGWIVDAVESEPADSLDEWYIAEANQQRVVQLQLRRALRPDQPVRITFRGHLQRSRLQPLRIDELAFVQPVGVPVTTHLMAMRPSGPLELETLGEWATRDWNQLAESRQALVEYTPGALVTDVIASSPQASVRLNSRPVAVAADVTIDATLRPSAWSWSYQVICRPETGTLDHVYLLFSDPVGEDLQWTDSVSGRAIPAERVTEAAPPWLAAAGGELWSIRLPEPRDSPFTLTAAVRAAPSGKKRIPLAGVPQSIAQTGRVLLRVEGNMPAIDGRGLSLAPAPSWSKGDTPKLPIRVAYRYRPEALSGAAETPRLEIAPPTAAQQPPGPLAWADIHSVYSADGRAVHDALYSFRAGGLSEFEAALPEGAELEAAWLDGQPVPDSGVRIAGRRVQIPLPPQSLDTVLRLRYTTAAEALHSGQAMPSPIPQVSSGAAWGRWTLWLPDGWDAVSDAGAHGGRDPTWRERLFGPWARAEGLPVFNPFSGESWAGLLPSSQDEEQLAAQAESWLATFGGQLQAASERRSALGVEPEGDSTEVEARHPTWAEVLRSVEVAMENGSELLIDAAALSEAGIGPGMPAAGLRQRDDSTTTGAGQVNAGQLAAAWLDAHHLAAVVLRSNTVIVTSRENASLWGAEPAAGGPAAAWTWVPAGTAGEDELARLPAATAGLLRAAQWSTMPLDVLPEAARPPAPPPHGWHARRITFGASPPGSVTLLRRERAGAWIMALALVGAAVGASTRAGRLRLGLIMLCGGAAAALVWPAGVFPLATAVVLATVVALVIHLVWMGGDNAGGAAHRPGSSITRSAASSTVYVLVLMAAAACNMAGTSAAQVPGAGDQTNNAAAADDATDDVAAGAIEEAGEPVAVATDIAASDAVPQPAIHQVLIPIDDQRRPVGEERYISETLYRLLSQRAQRSAPEQGRWLIRSVQVQGEIARSGGPAGPWMLVADMEVLVRDAEVVLPLIHDEAEWAESATWDGVPVPLAWSADGRTVRVTIPEPGEGRLQFAFRPRVLTEPGRSHVDLTLPPSLHAQLRLQNAADVPDLDLPGVVRSPEEGRYVADLGRARQLEVSWADATAENDQPAGNWRARQQAWLHLRPDGGTLDVRFSLAGHTEPPEHLRLRVDRRLRLVPLPEDGPVVAASADPQAPEWLELTLGGDLGEEIEIALEFELSSLSTLGRFVIPRVELADFPATPTRWAVSADAALSVSRAATGQPVTAPVDEFLTDWGAAAGRPEVVFAPAAVRELPAVEVRPRSAAASVSDELLIEADSQSLRAEYRADVVPDVWGRMTDTIEIDPAVQLDDVSIVQAEEPIPLDWSRPQADRLRVFPRRRIDAPYRLVVFGHVPLQESGRVAVPRIAAANRAADSLAVHLYRKENLQVALRGASVGDAEMVSPQPRDGYRRHGAFTLTDQDLDRVEIVVGGGSLQFDVDSLTSLQPGPEGWRATWTGHVRVREGVLDALPLDVPSSWAGPFEATPESAVGWSAEGSTENGQPAGGSAGASGVARRVQIRLPQSVQAGDETVIQFSGPLRLAAGEPLHVPQIQALAAAQAAQFFSVPAEIDPAATWFIREASPAESLPPALAAANSAGTGERNDSTSVRRLFQATGRQPIVQLRQSPQSPAPPVLRLVDCAVLLDGHARLAMVTRMVLDSHGRREAVLDIPVGQELAHVDLGGRAALTERVSPRRVRVFLGPAELPLLLDVWTTSVVGGEIDPAQVMLRRPKLLAGGQEVPAELSLWTVGGAEGRPEVVTAGDAVSTPREQALLRLDRLYRTAERATEPALRIPWPDGQHWQHNWAARLQEARRAAMLAEARAAGRPAAPQVEIAGDSSAELAPLIAKINAWGERFVAAETEPAAAGDDTNRQQEAEPGEAAASDAEDAVGPSGAVELTQVAGPATAGPAIIEAPLDMPNGRSLFFLGDGSLDTLTVALPSGGGSLALRAAAAALLVIAAAFLWKGDDAAFDAYASQWPQAWGLAAGMAWWWLLTPSAVGLLIVAVSLLSLVRTRIEARGLRRGG